jgi:hypothetical protein
MVVFGSQPKPASLKDFGDRFNIAHSIPYPDTQTDAHEANPYLLQILYTRKMFAGEDDMIQIMHTCITLMIFMRHLKLKPSLMMI